MLPSIILPIPMYCARQFNLKHHHFVKVRLFCSHCFNCFMSWLVADSLSRQNYSGKWYLSWRLWSITIRNHFDIGQILISFRVPDFAVLSHSFSSFLLWFELDFWVSLMQWANPNYRCGFGHLFVEKIDTGAWYCPTKLPVFGDRAWNDVLREWEVSIQA